MLSCVFVHIPICCHRSGAVFDYIEYFHGPFQGGASFVDYNVIPVLLSLCLHARLFIGALWSPAGKGLTSLLSFVMSNCEAVTLPLVSWVSCCSWFF